MMSPWKSAFRTDIDAPDATVVVPDPSITPESTAREPTRILKAAIETVPPSSEGLATPASDTLSVPVPESWPWMLTPSTDRAALSVAVSPAGMHA